MERRIKETPAGPSGEQCGLLEKRCSDICGSDCVHGFSRKTVRVLTN